jgi:hypothetical protein
VTFS